MTLDEYTKRWNKKTEVVYSPLDKRLNPDPIPTTLPMVDLILGGGLPRGKATMILGEKSSGKTIFAQLAIAGTQKQKGTILFFDIERTYDPNWFKLTGVDLDDENFKIMRPRTLEACFDMVYDALENEEPDLIVVDSISALAPQAYFEYDLSDKDHMGLKARKIAMGLEKIIPANKKTALLLVNQLRQQIGVIMGNPEAIPGGKALKFHSALILRARRGAWITDKQMTIEDTDDLVTMDDEAKRIGYIMRLRSDFSKVAPPWQETELKVLFNGAVDPISSIVRVAMQRGIINTVSKGYYTLPNSEEKIHGLPKTEEIVRANPDILEDLMERIKND